VSSSEKLSVGVIGLGHWGPNVVRSLSDHTRVQLNWVCDKRPEGLNRVSRFISSECKFTTQVDELVNSSEVEAVFVVTPASTHYALVKKFLEAGKHVFCEKPLTLEVGQDEELIQIAKEKNLHLMVGYTFLFNNGIRKAKELMDSGRLGDLYYITATRTHLGLIREDTSVVWDLAPHDVSIMNFLLGQVPERVSAVGARPLEMGKPDLAFLTLYYPQNVLGQIHVSWVDSNKERFVRVIGSDARLVFDDLNHLEPIRLFEKGIGLQNKFVSEFGSYDFLLRDGDIFSPKIDQQEPLKLMVDHFISVVLDNLPNPASGEFALNITKTLVAAHKSIENNGAPEVI
jgi:predicted dehydrogenase